jgi:Ni,Fe-hydrogenase I large subunit
MEPKKRKKQTRKNTSMQNLSSTQVESQYDSVSFSNIEQKVFNEINNEELKKALNAWEKQFKFKEKVHIRDLNLLKDMIGEYLDFNM